MILASLVTSVTTRPLEIPRAKSSSALVVVAHADDAVLFCGGLIAELVAAGYRVHVLRLTDDRWDSWGLDEDQTILRNRAEFNSAMQRLGVSHAHELGYQTDHLGDASEVDLRNVLIEKIREIRPYLIVGFDPDSYLFEDNRDHVVLAEALAEAMWCSGFDKHAVASGAAGAVSEIAPFLVAQKWYFGRVVAEATHHLDVTKHRQLLEDTILEHETMINNMAHQTLLRASTADIHLHGFNPNNRDDLRLYAKFLVTKSRAEGDALIERYRVLGDEDLRELAAFVSSEGEQR